MSCPITSTRHRGAISNSAVNGAGRSAQGFAMTSQEISKLLSGLADPERAAYAQHYFKTGPGEYGAGDRFLGI